MSADDPRRRVPRTDVALADPRLAAATTRLGPALVKTAVLAAQARARAGEITPEQVVPAAAAALLLAVPAARAGRCGELVVQVDEHGTGKVRATVGVPVAAGQRPPDVEQHRPTRPVPW